MDTSKLWRITLAEIELQVSKPVFKTIFAQTFLSSIEENTITIGCDNPLMIELLQKRYYSLIKSVLDVHVGRDVSLLFVAKQRLEKNPSTFGPLFSQSEQQPTITINLSDVKRQARLNAIYTFDTFAVSGSNQMAYAAASSVAAHPGTSYNPLFLYGGVGVGKTHLMQAVGHVLLSKNPKAKVVFSMGEEFTNEIIDAIRNKTTDVFKRKYRTAQLLLLDDIQFIAGKNTVQEEFFYTFNAIHQSGGQIIMTSDRQPGDIARLEDRLRSRFEGGLIIDISAPDFELRTAILLIKAKQKNVDLPIEVAKLVATNIEDTRKLEGTLIRLISESALHRTPIDEVLVRSVLGKTKTLLPNTQKTTPQQALDAVSTYFNLKPSQLKSDKRDKPIAVPRQILYYILRVELGLPLMDIGGFLGGRDHTTIMHGVKKVSQLLTIDEKLRGDIASIKERFVG